MHHTMHVLDAPELVLNVMKTSSIIRFSKSAVPKLFGLQTLLLNIFCGALVAWPILKIYIYRHKPILCQEASVQMRKYSNGVLSVWVQFTQMEKTLVLRQWRVNMHTFVKYWMFYKRRLVHTKNLHQC